MQEYKNEHLLFPMLMLMKLICSTERRVQVTREDKLREKGAISLCCHASIRCKQTELKFGTLSHLTDYTQSSTHLSAIMSQETGLFSVRRPREVRPALCADSSALVIANRAQER